MCFVINVEWLHKFFRLWQKNLIRNYWDNINQKWVKWSFLIFITTCTAEWFFWIPSPHLPTFSMAVKSGCPSWLSHSSLVIVLCYCWTCVTYTTWHIFHWKLSNNQSIKNCINKSSLQLNVTIHLNFVKLLFVFTFQARIDRNLNNKYIIMSLFW